MDTIEKLACRIQKILENNPTFLIGSGASVQYGLPTMGALADEIMSRLNDKYSKESSWKNFVEELEKEKNLENSLEVFNTSDWEIVESIIEIVWSFICQKDEEAFNNFLMNEKRPDLSDILEVCARRSGETNIITTNYDRIIEYSVDFIGGDLITGFKGFYYKCFSEYEGTKRDGSFNLFKVHGSIDWFIKKSRLQIFSSNFIKNMNNELFVPAIVTPGSGKYRETHKSPFREIIAGADKVLRKSNSYLCIGFGFNDEHIHPIIMSENRQKGIPIVIITKSMTDKIKKIFIEDKKENFIIICENNSGGSCVYYNEGGEIKYREFEESYWELKEFKKLWLG